MRPTRLWQGVLPILLALLFGSLATGCNTGSYRQEAGVKADWSPVVTNGNMQVSYSFDATTGNLTNITVGVTNALVASLMDSSSLTSKSLMSKTDLAAAGNRKGMLDNNAGIEGKLATDSKLDKILEGVAKLKSPLPITDLIPSPEG